jgi:N-acetylglutamate synthase-like GNAT family acetyltransferase
METANFKLRPATAADEAVIKKMVRRARINPTGLKWPRFTVVESPDGSLAACGQLKPHTDGSVELASLVVREDLRGRGLARLVIETLIEKHPAELYLTCRSELGSFYEKFGFRALSVDEMPAFFQRVKRLVGLFEKVAGKEMMLVMLRTKGASPEAA